MMTFKKNKALLHAILLQSNWTTALAPLLTDGAQAKRLISPLISFLPREDCRWQAIWGLGHAVAQLAAVSMEDARVIMRRLMWSMNEESGNLGWGIPEAMGSILARHAGLASEYARILFSYMHETGHDDNYLEHAPLRRGVYWAAGYLVAYSPAYVKDALPKLLPALADEDIQNQAYALWAIAQCLRAERLLSTDHIGDGAEKDSLCTAKESQRLKTYLATWVKQPYTVRLLDGDAILTYTAKELGDFVAMVW